MKASQAFRNFVELSREGFITTRDIALLDDLLRFKFMSLKQIARLYYPTAGGRYLARRRMLKLYKKGLVERYRLPHAGGTGAAEYVYTLAHTGAFFLAAGTGREVSELGWKPRERIGQMAHAVALAEVYSLFKRAERLFAAVLTQFKPEPVIQGKGFILRPDAAFSFKYRGKQYLYFLEVDMGTEWRNKIISKVESYAAYYDANRIRPGFVMPVVLFVVPDTGRTTKLKEWVTGAQKGGKLPFKFGVKGKMLKELK